jgi:hypothetical protein
VFFDTLEVIAADTAGTRRCEDGVKIDPMTREIFIVSVIPDFSMSNFNCIARALQERRQYRLNEEYFFDRRVEGISKTHPTEVLVYRSLPPYNVATIGLGKAIVVKSFSFEEADELCEHEPQLRLLMQYGKDHDILHTDTRSLITFLISQLNQNVMSAMLKENIPFLSHHSGSISISKGQLTINCPYRDTAAYINTAQISSWMKTGEPTFSRWELASMISEVEVMEEQQAQ